MDRSELAPLLARLYNTSREQLDMTLKLTCGLRAAIEVLDEVQPGFGEAYRERFESLKCGELGKQEGKGLAAFDEMIGRLKKRHRP
jgi:hypothetical protein